MRAQTTITINDAGQELTFRITKFSCVQLEFFLLKVGKIVARSGLLDEQFDDEKKGKSNMDIALEAHDAQGALASVADVLLKNLPSAWANLDVNATRELLAELFESCVSKVDGKSVRTMTLDEIEATIQTLPALWELQKEAIKFNVDFFQKGGNLSCQGSPQTEKSTSEQKISLRSHRY